MIMVFIDFILKKMIKSLLFFITEELLYSQSLYINKILNEIQHEFDKAELKELKNIEIIEFLKEKDNKKAESNFAQIGKRVIEL